MWAPSIFHTSSIHEVWSHKPNDAVQLRLLQKLPRRSFSNSKASGVQLFHSMEPDKKQSHGVQVVKWNGQSVCHHLYLHNQSTALGYLNQKGTSDTLGLKNQIWSDFEEVSVELHH